MTEVDFGAKANRATVTQEGKVVYFNKRAEMWGLMHNWLPGAVIDNDPELIADITGVQSGFAIKDGRDAIQLERKDDMTWRRQQEQARGSGERHVPTGLIVPDR